MKFKLVGALLIAAMGTGTMLAQDGGWRRGRDLGNDYADRRADLRDIQQDRAKIAHDQWELRRDLRDGNYRGAAHERAELNEEYRDINRDRVDVHRDTRDIRNERRYGW
jgi:hypothetical protein